MLSYKIDAREGIVEISGPTAQDLDSFRDLMRRIVTDPSFRPGFGFLRHRRGPDAPPTELLRRAIELLKTVPELPSCRWAVVVESKADFGMMRMAEMISTGAALEVGVFWTREEARRWLTETAKSEETAKT